jgi:AcrR family transcriptional regulator
MLAVGKGRREEILDAARREFSARGYGGATIDAIAVEAGVAKGTVYLYFESKRELFLACLRDGVVELHGEAERRMAEAATCEEKLRAFIATRFAYFAQNRAWFRIYYTEFAQLIAGTANAQPEFQDLYEEQLRRLAGLLAEGGVTGAERKARLVYDLVRAALAHHILHEGGEAPEEAVEAVHEFVWKGIGGR